MAAYSTYTYRDAYKPVFHSDFTVGDIVKGSNISGTAEVVYVGEYGLTLYYNGRHHPYSSEYYENLTIVTPPFKPVILYTLKQKGDK